MISSGAETSQGARVSQVQRWLAGLAVVRSSERYGRSSKIRRLGRVGLLAEAVSERLNSAKEEESLCCVNWAGWSPGSRGSWVLSLNLRCVLMLPAAAAVTWPPCLGPGLPRLVLLGSRSLVSGENQTSQGRASFPQIRPGSRTGGG